MTSGIATGAEDESERGLDRRAGAVVQALGQRSIVLIGLMGSGKTSTGRRLAQQLGLEFSDADAEIEAAAGLSISEIFARHGEAYFRDGERRVMARLLGEGQRVLATGGGAFMDEETRARIAAAGISIWLKADLDVLWRRVRKRSHRPLLQNSDPEETLRQLMEQRYPIYERADITVISQDGPQELAVEEVIKKLEFFLRFSRDTPPPVKPRLMPLPNCLGRPSESQANVRVELGSRSYSILIGDGLIGEAADHVRRRDPKAACAILTDENVAGLHLARLEQALDAVSIRHSCVIVPPGERAKSFAEYARVCNTLIECKLERGDFIIALGGGVVGDLAGFVAATLRRGMRFIQVPTTLLAQVDSSVGGKTGINAPLGKNLIGAFHQPSLVLADTATLDTLPEREFRAGYAEIVKYGLIADAEFFDWLDIEAKKVCELDLAALNRAVLTSCRMKAEIVAGDERETGDSRALLNFGHTFGHALEAETGFGDVLLHGEAVALGMVLAFDFAVRLGIASGQDATRVRRHIARLGLPSDLGAVGLARKADRLLAHMAKDKKVRDGRITLILPRRIGDAYVMREARSEDLREFLAEAA